MLTEISDERAALDAFINRIIDDPTADRCVCCGAIVPEGRIICPICEGGQNDQ